MTAITSLKIFDQEFNYASARYDVVPRALHGAIAQATYVIISFDTEDKAQAENYEVLQSHDKKQFVPVAVNGSDKTGYIEENLNDPVGVIRIRFQ
ncbi:hypothetical protein VS869_003459 [Yersinia enterocolitica]|nr:hypothetical protein [Yersinia enterocolitica]EME2526584.1 hypothetical protein [Yersinia enterocolitica]